MSHDGTRSSDLRMRQPKKREVKSCMACAKLKVKCEIGRDGETCKRCHRLGKACEKQHAGAHSNKRCLDGPSSRADLLRLESKLNSVSQLLSASSHSSLPPLSPPLTTSPMPGLQGDTHLPAGAEANALLRRFRVEFAPLFPFVTVPHDTTSDQLRSDKPILHSVIAMLAYQSDVQRQLAMARKVQYNLSQAVMVRGERSLALLQGLLVYVAWNHAHIQLGHHLMMLLHTAMAMVTDLGLDREPHIRPKTAAGALRDVGLSGTIEPSRTLDERRALLGVFWIASITNTCFKEVQTLPFTRYAEQCCTILEEANENSNDVYLIQLARLQQRVQSVGHVLYCNDIDATSSMTAPLSMAIRSFERDILSSETMLRLDILQAPLLQMSNKMLQIHLFKVALDDQLFSSPSDNMLRTNLLFSCLTAIDSLLAIFFALPASTIFSLPYPNWGQLGHAMLILTRLSEVKHSAWDVSIASSILDHRKTYMRLAQRLEIMTAIGQSESPVRCLPEVFTLMAERFRELGDAEVQREEIDLSATADFLYQDEMMGGILFELLDFGQGF